MALEFLGNPEVLMFFAVFVVFVIVAYKIVKWLFKALLIGLIAALFPVVGSVVFGLNIPVTLENIAWFAVTALILFAGYTLVKIAWKSLRIAFKPAKWIWGRHNAGGDREPEKERHGEPKEKHEKERHDEIKPGEAVEIKEEKSGKEE